MQTGGRMCRAWEELEPLTIAAIEGWCIGGGAALVAACDLRVASEAATFYVPEIERGMNLYCGAVTRITRLLGPARAKRAVILAEKISGRR
jgi:enoyl-CoA hydratase/carnithine racemase